MDNESQKWATHDGFSKLKLHNMILAPQYIGTFVLGLHRPPKGPLCPFPPGLRVVWSFLQKALDRKKEKKKELIKRNFRRVVLRYNHALGLNSIINFSFRNSEQAQKALI